MAALGAVARGVMRAGLQVTGPRGIVGKGFANLPDSIPAPPQSPLQNLLENAIPIATPKRIHLLGANESAFSRRREFGKIPFFLRMFLACRTTRNTLM
jgi:hypothetical protein